MPYSSNKALPDAVRRLPERDQDVWRDTFSTRRTGNMARTSLRRGPLGRR